MPIYFPNFVNYVGECGASGGFFCGECEGDCDSNDDCTGDLVCSQRSGIEAVPGCTGEGGARDVYGKDICVKPPSMAPVATTSGVPSMDPVATTTSVPSMDPVATTTTSAPSSMAALEVQFVANPCKNAFDGGPCLECTGDCDNDSDCAGDLRCAQRSGQSGNVNVPGCVWGEGSDDLRFDDDDFCTLMCSSFWASCGLFACVD